MNLLPCRIFAVFCVLASAAADAKASSMEVSAKATLSLAGQKLMRAQPHEHHVEEVSSLGEISEHRKPVAGFKKYHTATEIFALIEKSVGKCKLPLSTEWMKDQDGQGQLFVARIGNPAAKKKMLVAANEHARELLTGEVVLRLIQSACGTLPTTMLSNDDDRDGSSMMEEEIVSLFSQKFHESVLSNVQFIFVPVVNVRGRQMVETLQNDCQRTTIGQEGDVDLNRNMEVDWGKGEPQQWGPKPFSTYQARILRDLAAKDKYAAYIDLHTGARSLMTSWGFKPKTDPDFIDQKKILDIIKAKHCHDCEIGSNRVVIGYENPGEVIDHMYATQKIKYSTLWELYAGHASGCLNQFNPPDDRYESHVNNWSNALLTFGDYVHNHVDESEQSNPGNPNALIEVENGGMLIEDGTTGDGDNLNLNDKDFRMTT